MKVLAYRPGSRERLRRENLEFGTAVVFQTPVFSVDYIVTVKDRQKFEEVEECIALKFISPATKCEFKGVLSVACFTTLCTDVDNRRMNSVNGLPTTVVLCLVILARKNSGFAELFRNTRVGRRCRFLFGAVDYASWRPERVF